MLRAERWAARSPLSWLMLLLSIGAGGSRPSRSFEDGLADTGIPSRARSPPRRRLGRQDTVPGGSGSAPLSSTPSTERLTHLGDGPGTHVAEGQGPHRGVELPVRELPNSPS